VFGARTCRGGVVILTQALCAVLEYELSPSGEDKLDVMTTLHRTNVGKQRQTEVADRLRMLKLMVSFTDFY